jgi:type IV pilus assembly protein PilA
MARTLHKKAAAAGFTLIELMIVVAIVGILAVLAVEGVRKYVTNSKTAEARNSLGAIGQGAAAAFEKESMGTIVLAGQTSAGMSRRLCPSASTTVPATSASISGKKYQSSYAAWNVDQPTNAGFACLKFTMDQPQYYMYGYTLTGVGSSVGDSFTATAQGDLNGDGTLSLFQLNGTVGNGSVLNLAPNLLEVRSDE